MEQTSNKSTCVLISKASILITTDALISQNLGACEISGVSIPKNAKTDKIEVRGMTILETKSTKSGLGALGHGPIMYERGLLNKGSSLVKNVTLMEGAMLGLVYKASLFEEAISKDHGPILEEGPVENEFFE